MIGAHAELEHRSRAWIGLGLCLLLVLISMQARVWRALSDPNFDQVQSEGMLKSDPALLCYITERIIDAGGVPPADFRADARIQHPLLTDIPAEFTVGQEFLVAWAYRASGSQMPLHVFATRFMSLIAALTTLGIYGLVWWRTRHLGWALGAATLFCLLPANYRTIGFIFIREDLSLPLFLAHLALLARADQLRTAAAYLWSGFALALALATWHAMGFFVVLELLALHAWFLRRGPSPFESQGSWAVLLGPIMAASLVPALQAAGLLFGTAMQLALALLAIGAWRVRHQRRHAGAQLGRGASVLYTLSFLGLMLVAGAILNPGASSYAHVFDVVRAKLLWMGERPLDPNAISFDARLLWQGPFESLPLGSFGALLGWSLLLLPLGLWRALAGKQRLAGLEAFLLLFLIGSLPTAWLVGRTVILVGALIPLLAIPLARSLGSRLAPAAFVLILVLQAISFAGFLESMRISWYQPAERQTEIAALVRWVDQNLDRDEAIVADFMSSTAILVHAGNRIVLQPKYETARSRERARLFLETFFRGSSAELAALVREDFQSDLLLVDRYTLGVLSPWVAGEVDGPRAGSAGELLLSGDEGILGSIPGFELLYRSPASITNAQGVSSDYFRLYRIAQDAS